MNLLFWRKQTPKREPIRFRFSREVSKMLCELMDQVYACPIGQRNAARHALWSAIVDALPKDHPYHQGPNTWDIDFGDILQVELIEKI